MNCCDVKFVEHVETSTTNKQKTKPTRNTPSNRTCVMAKQRKQMFDFDDLAGDWDGLELAGPGWLGSAWAGLGLAWLGLGWAGLA